MHIGIVCLVCSVTYFFFSFLFNPPFYYIPSTVYRILRTALRICNSITLTGYAEGYSIAKKGIASPVLAFLYLLSIGTRVTIPCASTRQESKNKMIDKEVEFIFFVFSLIILQSIFFFLPRSVWHVLMRTPEDSVCDWHGSVWSTGYNSIHGNR